MESVSNTLQPASKGASTGQSSSSIKRKVVTQPIKISRYTIDSAWMEDKRQMLLTEQEMRCSNTSDPSRKSRRIIKDKIETKDVYPANAFAPKRHKAKIVIWSDLTVDALDRLNESMNAEHIKNVLADIFILDNYKESVKTGILMDLYFYTLQFCRDQSFSPEKTSAFFSIIKKIFEVCIETPFGNLDFTFEYFKDLIHCHSVNRPPYSIELFKPDEVRKMTEYTINSFFRHFKMYKYAFTPLVRLDLGINYIGMPPSPPPSEEMEAAEINSQAIEGESKEENKVEEIDEEKQAAKEELKHIIKNYLGAEAKRIEGTVDTQLKFAVEALNTKIEQMGGFKTDAKTKKK